MPYFISATDFGSGNNDKYPRWRVHRFNDRRTSWGHIGNTPVSGYFWTQEEARRELDRLEGVVTIPDFWRGVPHWVSASIVALVVVLLVGRFVLGWW